MLGKEDMTELLRERGSIEVFCEFCNQRYEFDQIDMEQVFAEEMAAPGNETRH
jgi:molecular chaperone Hsp33